MEVKVNVDKQFFELLLKKMPWLAYESPEAFAEDAVRTRFETLFILYTKK